MFFGDGGSWLSFADLLSAHFSPRSMAVARILRAFPPFGRRHLTFNSPPETKETSLLGGFFGFLEMGGVAFRGGTSCPVRSRPPRRYSTIHGLIDAPRFNIPLKNKKSSLSGGFLVFWRWGELNPRPVVQIRSVYRFIGARWLSGPGGSAESVGSVSEKSVLSIVPARRKASSGWRRKIRMLRSSIIRFPRSATYAARAKLSLFSAVIKFARSEDERPHLQLKFRTPQSNPVHPRCNGTVKIRLFYPAVNSGSHYVTYRCLCP